ncbi:MAG: rhodanese-like domain-containing protein, partial [Anaerolineales bacterium]|nr:rhodanese-like domain-containing protein [Anaerolineales bacterium]
EDHCLRYEHAISFLYHRILDPAICVYECSQHVFLECQNLPKNAEHALGLSIKTEIPAGDVAGVSPLELWAELHIPSPPRIIDVREPREFKRKHIPQAESRPLSNLLADTEQIEINENIVFVCHGGRRSTRVTYFFAQQGYLSVRVLRGGLLAWEHAGLLEAVDSQSSL